VAFSTQRKESTLRAKRLKRDPSLGSLGLSRDPSRASLGGAESEGGDGAAAIPPEDVQAEVQAAVDAVKLAKPVGSDICLDAVRRLRQLLSNYDEPPFKEAVAAGAVPVLVAALQPQHMSATALETIFEAAWAITNLAVVRRGLASFLVRLIRDTCLLVAFGSCDLPVTL
jgi:hypothetical protein